MKIIQNNNCKNEKETPKQITCPHCKSELEYNSSDISNERCLNGKQWITCPCCNNKIDLNKETTSELMFGVVPQHETVCADCGNTIVYDPQDVTIGAFGCASITCPDCGIETPAEQDDIVLTPDNIKFPQHFYKFGTCTSSSVSDKQVKEWIEQGVQYFRKNPEEFNWFAATGDTFVSMWNLSEDESYNIVVAKNYWESDIPYEDVDYKLQESIKE